MDSHFGRRGNKNTPPKCENINFIMCPDNVNKNHNDILFISTRITKNKSCLILSVSKDME